MRLERSTQLKASIDWFRCSSPSCVRLLAVSGTKVFKLTEGVIVADEICKAAIASFAAFFTELGCIARVAQFDEHSAGKGNLDKHLTKSVVCSFFETKISARINSKFCTTPFV